mgnify:CR=1 FL=1
MPVGYTERMKNMLSLLFFVSLLSVSSLSAATEYRCQPTPEDEMGPFYRPDAPLRSKIGNGYLLTGTVISAVDCHPVPAPLIEFWQTSPNGRYDDDYRAAIITDATGTYRLETNLPPAYASRTPHIHIRVSAKGFQPLVTQHYLKPGTKAARFDLVLIPTQ